MAKETEQGRDMKAKRGQLIKEVESLTRQTRSSVCGGIDR